MQFVYGFITGVISFALLFNVIHKRMLAAFQKAVDKFVKIINDTINQE